MSPLTAWLTGLLMVAIFMVATWWVQCRTRNAGIVDVVWSFSLGFLALWYAAVGSASGGYRLLIAVLGGVWSLRLGVHLWLRIKGKPEDGRYRRLRDSWGDKQNLYMFGFFQVQALIDAVLSLPFLIIAFRPDAGFGFWTAAGIAVWISAVLGEAIADAQLLRFNSRPENHGKVCKTGLWHYSRHPNYFFEWLHWFAYVFIAVGAPLWWVTLLGPALMLWLLLKVTGIPYTEQQTLNGPRGSEYREYQERTSAFLPWFPKK